MNTTMDNEWAELVRDWQSSDRPPPNLERRVKRGTWAQYGGIALSAVLVAMFVSMPVGAYLQSRSRGDVYVFGVIALFGLSITVVTLRSLLGALRPEANTTRAYLELSRRRIENELRAARTIRRSCLALLAFGAVLFPLRAYAVWVSHGALPWAPLGWALARFLGIIALLWFSTPFARRRNEAKLAAIDEVLAELT